MVKFGYWLFHYRNFLFPFFYAALFIPTSFSFVNNELAVHYPRFSSLIPSGLLTPNVQSAEILGLIFIFCGIPTRSVTIGLVYIVRGGSNRQVYANDLVTEGIYSVCRNPMYLGNILLLFGFGIFSDSVLFTFVFFPLFVLFYVAIIRAEEAFLLNKFGQVFIDYKKNVRAIVPNIMAIGRAFKGHKFKWKKVLSKEHTAYYIYGLGIILLLFYKGRVELKAFIVCILVLSFLNLLVKILKHKRLLVD